MVVVGAAEELVAATVAVVVSDVVLRVDKIMDVTGAAALDSDDVVSIATSVDDELGVSVVSTSDAVLDPGRAAERVVEGSRPRLRLL